MELVNIHAKEIGFNDAHINQLINSKIDAALAKTDWKKITDTVATDKIKKLII